MKLRIAVLQGGPSAEAEVSRVSAREVAAGLREAGHRVEVIELDRRLTDTLLSFDADVVFPALHGPPGEDGTIQGYLDTLGLPYVGAGVRGSAVAMDKGLAKALFRRAGLPVLDDVVLPPGISVKVAAQQIREAFSCNVVIKPAAAGSALGVTPNVAPADLPAALTAALQLGGGAIVEPFIHGKEVTGGVLDLHQASARALPVIEVRTAANQWYDYTNRYTVGKSEHIVSPEFPQHVLDALQQIALAAHQVLELRDLSRADFIVTDRYDIHLLEVNSLPGMTPTSLFPDAAAHAGMDFSTLVSELALSAYKRGSSPLSPA